MNASASIPSPVVSSDDKKSEQLHIKSNTHILFKSLPNKGKPCTKRYAALYIDKGHAVTSHDEYDAVHLREPSPSATKIVAWDFDQTLFDYEEYKKNYRVSSSVENFIMHYQEVRAILAQCMEHKAECMVVTKRDFDVNTPNHHAAVYTIIKVIGLEFFYKIIFTNGKSKYPALKDEHEALLGATSKQFTMLVDDGERNYDENWLGGFSCALVKRDNKSHLGKVIKFVSQPKIRVELPAGYYSERDIDSSSSKDKIARKRRRSF